MPWLDILTNYDGCYDPIQHVFVVNSLGHILENCRIDSGNGRLPPILVYLKGPTYAGEINTCIFFSFWLHRIFDKTFNHASLNRRSLLPDCEWYNLIKITYVDAENISKHDKLGYLNEVNLLMRALSLTKWKCLFRERADTLCLPQSGNTKGGSITVPLISCLTGLD